MNIVKKGKWLDISPALISDSPSFPRGWRLVYLSRNILGRLQLYLCFFSYLQILQIVVTLVLGHLIVKMLHWVTGYAQEVLSLVLL